VVEIRVERTIQAAPGALWSYLSTARGLSAWHADEVRGDLGKGEFLARYPSLGAELTLRVDQVRIGEAITLAAGTSRVELALVPLGTARCQVQITHRGLDADDDLPGFRASWALALALLDVAATRHPNTIRHVRWFFGHAKVPAGLVHYYFSSRQGLAEWLGKTELDLGPEGSPAHLRLTDSISLSGPVLCNEVDRDLCVLWSELNDAALVLRTLPAGPSERKLALAVSTFGRPLDKALEATLTTALGRLQERLRQVGKS
jgi:hypothetical protein